MSNYCECCPHKDAGTSCPAIHSIDGRSPHPPFCGLCTDPAYREFIANGEFPKPSLLKQAVNFGQASIEHALAGLPQATLEQQEERLAICRGCEFFKDNFCLVCGCVLSGAKLRWAEQQCPLENPKWGPIAP